MAAPTPQQTTISETAQTVTRRVVIPIGGDADVTATNVLDISTFTTGITGTDFVILEISHSIDGFSIILSGDATTDKPLAILAGTGHHDFRSIGGLPNDAGTGKTGDMMLTTSGLGATTESGFVVFTIKKV